MAAKYGEVMMTDDLMLRIAVARESLFRCIEDELNRDPHHKSYEGAMEISMSLPSIFDRSAPPEWVITWHCYVVPDDGRRLHWSGRTLAEAVAVMEDAVKKITLPYEMARFESQFEDCVDEEGEADGSTVIYGPGRSEDDEISH